MGSSKKHKKHKDKDKERDKRQADDGMTTALADQKPLRLVLKVGSASTTVDRSPSISTVTQYPDIQQDEDASSSYHESKSNSEFGSSKKLKKKKSKKKHKKHSHHHHHHHHHKHKSTCSHHSKSRDSMNDSRESLDASKLSVDTSSLMDVDQGAAPAIDVSFDVPMAVTDTQGLHDGEQAASQQSIDPITISSPPKSPQRVSYKSSVKHVYHNLFTFMLRQLEKRDPNAFFAWPVTDLIAPGYSTIIKNPMDFYTIRKRIEQRFYDTIAEFKADVKLMCDNAMTYNQSDTIYYKTARKLWHYARDKVFTRDNISEARSQASASNLLLPSIVTGEPPAIVPLVNESTTLGDVASTNCTSLSVLDSQPSASTVDMETDDESAASVLAQAQKAAAIAAEKLAHSRPQGAHLSFLRLQADGSTTLAIVGAPAEAERTLSINDLVGKLPEGTPYLPSYSEPDSNKIKPVESVNTLPFSSYLPSLDSSKSKLTQEETSLLLSAYGDEEIGIPYTQSVLDFAGDSEYLIQMVDNLLDILTQGQHARVLEHMKKCTSEKETTSSTQVSTNGQEDKDPVTEKLSETASLLNNLQSVQRKRLSSTTKPSLASAEEVQLAAKLSDKLTAMISSCTAPIDVTDIKSIRKAMGVQVKD